MPSGATIVELPGGFWRDGAYAREVALRGLKGEDELWLAEEAGDAPPAVVVSELLGRCVVNRATRQPAGRELAGALTVGDREALLLHLRRLSFGDSIPATLACPECRERMDLDLAASMFLLDQYQEVHPSHETVIGFGGCDHRVVFRLPTGADQEAASESRDPAAGARSILARCVLECDPPVLAGEWPPEAIESIGSRMAQLDPQAELHLALACPSCQAKTDVIFDTAAYFLCELGMRQRLLLSEVHVLASHYHWSESEILGLSRTRRHAYLELVAGSMEARNTG